jgi:hypothetical protein
MQEQKFVRQLKIITVVRDPIGTAVGVLNGKRC